MHLMIGNLLSYTNANKQVKKLRRNSDWFLQKVAAWGREKLNKEIAYERQKDAQINKAYSSVLYTHMCNNLQSF